MSQAATTDPMLAGLDDRDRAALAGLAEQRWRLWNLYWITNKAGEVVRFVPNWAQAQILDALWWNTCVLKARQLGISTLFHVLALDNALFTPNFAGSINSYDMPSIIKLMARNVFTPYDRLPSGIRDQIPETARAAGDNPYIRFGNGSRIEGALTARSDTYQWLHVSELGRTAAKFPARASEIFTGSMQSVADGKGLRIIESTAETEEGAFAEVVEQARQQSAAAIAEGRKLTIQDWKLIFLPWWGEPGYAQDPQGVIITPSERKYFAQLDAKGIRLTAAQKAWYVQKKNGPKMGTLKMRKEYPSTAAEAFEGDSEGTVYGEQMAEAVAQGRIAKVPVTPGIPVDTSWDLGLHDYTSIWLWQRIGRELRAVGFLEDNGKPWSYYAQLLNEFRERGIIYGRHYLPHDARNRSGDTLKHAWQSLEELGIAPTEIIDTPDEYAGRQQARDMLRMVIFDAVECADGIKHLKSHRKEWSERLGAYVDRARHDEHSHAASALRIYAQATDGGRIHPGGINKRKHYPRSNVA